MVFWVITLTLVLASAGLVALLSSRHAWRWGKIAIAPEHVGEGAYRTVEVGRAIPRGIPRRIQWAAGTGFVWAVVTFFVFAPAGLLLALVTPHVPPRTAVLPLSLSVVCLSGFALAVYLVVVGVSLLRGRPGASERARAAAIWSWIHHAAVFFVFALIVFPGREGWPFVAIPCVIGAAQAALSFAASRAPEPVVINEGRWSVEHV